MLECGPEEFRRALQSENHTLKRSLTDPRLFSGIGNAYSDEILHRARLSPMKQTRHLDEAEIDSLYAAVREVLQDWCRWLREEAGDGFPEKVTAFRPGMAAATASRVPTAAPAFSGSVMRPTSATTARNARQADGSWPTVRSRVS